MATNFPTSLDALTNPQATDSLTSPSHSAQHANANDAIEALEAKVGVNGSAVTSSLDYKVTQLETNSATLTGSQTLSNKTLTAPKFADLGFIADANGNEMIIFDTVPSAVNEVTLANAAASGTPTLTATGSDTNISLNLVSKGTGTVQANGFAVVNTNATQTLFNKTLSAPVISTISDGLGGTLTLPTGVRTLVARDTTENLTNKDISNGSMSNVIVDQLQENWNISATAATGTINLNFTTASIWYYTSNASANHTINIRGSASNSLNVLVAVGDSITVVWMVTNGATPYYPNVIQVDGTTVTPKWAGGVAPTSGNANSIDSYTFTVVKTAATPTYTVFASRTQFK